MVQVHAFDDRGRSVPPKYEEDEGAPPPMPSRSPAPASVGESSSISSPEELAARKASAKAPKSGLERNAQREMRAMCLKLVADRNGVEVSIDDLMTEARRLVFFINEG